MPEHGSISPREYAEAVGEATRRKEQLRGLQAEMEALKAERDSLRAERDALRADLGAIAREHDELKAAVGPIAAERDGLRERLDAAERERDDFQRRLEKDPEDLRGQIANLRGEIRTRDHKDRWRALAVGEEFRVRPDAVEALWTLSGYAPEGDEVDERKIREAIGATVRANPFLLRTDPAGSGSRAPDGVKPAEGTAPAKGPGPGAVRGGSPRGASPPSHSVEAIVRARAERAGIAWGGAPANSLR